jgi:hypothetical protein
MRIQSVASGNGHFKNVIHVPDSNLSTSIGRHRPFLILLQSHMIVFDGFCEVSALIFTRTTCIGGIDMIWVDIKNRCEIIYALL